VALKAVVFDFDGVILDTERPVYESWRWAFAEHGADLTVEEWASCIGRADAWDPLDKLASRAVVDEAVLARRHGVRDALLAAESVLPGVLDWLGAASELGLRVGVASSSPESWVAGHLERLGLVDHFACVACHRDGVRGKPAPDLYLEAVDGLGVAPGEAVAVEDSANGVAAAKAAGLFCVAVPHGLTAHLDLSAADLLVDSLASVSLPSLVDQWDQWSRPARSVGA
jgi:HAD superfamily hydrolase (TIGR01509 family)